MNKSRESAARTRVKKAMASYDLAIQKITMENGNNPSSNSCYYASYYPNGKSCSSATSTYDTKGNKISDKYYDSNENLISEVGYNHDNCGNIVKYNNNGTEYSIE